MEKMGGGKDVVRMLLCERINKKTKSLIFIASQA